MSLGENLKALREDPYTAKAGMKWTPEEDAELVTQATSGMDFIEIATHHKRTAKGVKSRVMAHALNYLKTQDANIEDVAKHFHVTIGQLTEYKRKADVKQQEKEKEQQKKQEENQHNMTGDKYMDILVEIRDFLKVIAAQ